MKSFRLSILVAFAFLVACDDSTDPAELTTEQIIERGGEIAGKSQSALASTLVAQIEKSGFEGAVSFCHVNASPIVDSLEAAHDVKIRRTSFRHRNPNNEPDELDRDVLSIFEEKSESGEDLTPVVKTDSEAIRYYQPIMVMPLCTNCHGMPGEILTADLHALILDEYPDDEAVGYEVGDFRGAWVVEFATKQESK